LHWRGNSLNLVRIGHFQDITVDKMSEPKEKRPNPTAEETLGPQLGTDPKHLSIFHTFDPRILSKLEPTDVLWISYFSRIPDLEGGEYARDFIADFEKYAVSVEGWRTNKMIQMVAAGKGTTSGVEFLKKPGWFGRNISDRKWKEKAEEEGKVIVE